MDRREAVLRELNLYPLWVRRDHAASNAISSQPVETGAVSKLPDAANGNTHDVNNPGKPQPAESGAGTSFADHQPAVPVDEPTDRPAPVVDSLSWIELKQRVRDCSLCKLRAGCTQTVLGVGDEKADWLFVGEGPGADEDAQGESFVGQAGKLLDNMLLAMNLKRGKSVYIANVVKCRPPGNRAPENDEIQHCLPYLQRQIGLIQPRIIVALGKVASNALMGRDATLASLRGTPHDYKGIPLIVTYHPAYLLRSPSEKAKAWQDLRLAQQTIQAPG